MSSRKKVMDDLESYRIAYRRLQNLVRQREELKSMAFSLGSGVGGGGGHSTGPKDARYTKAVNALADLDEAYEAEINGLKYAIQRTTRRIEQCKSNKARNVLWLYYRDRMTAMQISIELDTSERHVQRLKKKGIEDLIAAEEKKIS